MKSEKSNALEGIRGIAAFIVVFWHSLLGFLPSGSGIFEQWSPDVSFQGSPVFIALNGSASVVLFFVLSGYVLTASSLKTNNTEILYRNGLKRWPRLVGPVLCAVLFSYALFKLNAYWYEEAAKVSQSPWLYKFGYAYDKPFTPDFWAAMRQGLYATFIYGESFYDSSLWTMKYEFIGSFIVLAIALVTILTRKLVLPIILLCIFAPVLTLVGHSAFYMGFLAGCALSSIAAMNVTFRSGTSIISIAVGIYLFGYAGHSIGLYRLIPVWFGNANALILLHTIAATLILGGVILTPSINAALNKPFMRTLGWLSFPIYLIHVPILCSIGSWVYLQAPAWGLSPAPTAILATIGLSTLACLPLAIVNDLWVQGVNRSCNMLLARAKAVTHQFMSAPKHQD